MLGPASLRGSACKLQKQPTGLLLLLLLEGLRKWDASMPALKSINSLLSLPTVLNDIICFQKNLHDCHILKISEIVSQKSFFSKLVG